jgi:hypothetical protein
MLTIKTSSQQIFLTELFEQSRGFQDPPVSSQIIFKHDSTKVQSILEEDLSFATVQVVQNS